MIPERLDASTVELGPGLKVRRALPTRHRRMVGAWCFLDHFGPLDLSRSDGMRVGPHPHTGLQTLTWLLKGELLHRDSLGTVQAIEPGAVNLMTAGCGISHSEDSTQPEVHGVQFWIALPNSARAMAPGFQHVPKVPMVHTNRMQISVLAGEFMGERSPATVHTPLMGASIEVPAGALATLPINPAFEHGAIVTHGRAEIAGQRVIPGALIYLTPGRSGLPIVSGAGDAGVVLVGGAPFPEEVLMWWNFVGRNKDELTKATRDWNAGATYLGEVKGALSPRLVAPLPPWGLGPPTVTVPL